MMAKVDVRSRGRQQVVATLSGGNQQKVALAKWLATQARVFLLDEPTVGIDVGAKAEIYQLVNALAREGVACLLVSADIPEILSLSSRVIVMRKGAHRRRARPPRRRPRRTSCTSPSKRSAPLAREPGEGLGVRAQ